MSWRLVKYSILMVIEGFFMLLIASFCQASQTLDSELSPIVCPLQENSFEMEVNPREQSLQGVEIVNRFTDFLARAPRTAPAAMALGRYSRSLRAVIHFVLENVIQHGSEEVERRNENPGFELLKVRVPIKVIFLVESGHYVIRVINRQVKPFPKSMIGEFSVGRTPVFSQGERVGNVGKGIGHRQILKNARELPRGSSVSWGADGEYVTFELRIAHGF